MKHSDPSSDVGGVDQSIELDGFLRSGGSDAASRAAESRRKIMIKIIHPLAGASAISIIAIFWVSTIGSELFGDQAAVTAVKTAIPWGFILLVPSLAATGGTGFARARGRRLPLLIAKITRMRVIAANGVVILIPSALFLAAKAKAAEFDASFYAVQILELAAGAVNLALLGFNMRDGFRMTGRFRPATT